MFGKDTPPEWTAVKIRLERTARLLVHFIAGASLISAVFLVTQRQIKGGERNVCCARVAKKWQEYSWCLDQLEASEIPVKRGCAMPFQNATKKINFHTMRISQENN
jgi:hypothetical protein